MSMRFNISPRIAAALNAFHARIFPARFQILLIALLCVFVINIFFPDNIYGGIAQSLYLPFQIIACFLVFASRKRLFFILGMMACLLMASRILNIFFAKDIQNEMALLYICFFGAVFWEVMRQIYTFPLRARQIVLAGICGLLLIGYCGFYIFLCIELYQPGSFSGLSASGSVNDLFYFSYITILTVGYGHITPDTWIAQNATVLVALTAYIYSWVVIATIVGEATSEKNKRARQGEENIAGKGTEDARPSATSTPAPEHPDRNSH